MAHFCARCPLPTDESFNSYDAPWSWGRVSGFMTERRLINYYTLNQDIPGEIVQFLAYILYTIWCDIFEHVVLYQQMNLSTHIMLHDHEGEYLVWYKWDGWFEYHTLNQHFPTEIIQFLLYFWTLIVATIAGNERGTLLGMRWDHCGEREGTRVRERE